jgi:DNA-binding GntR family transcriptional regulator
VSHVARGSRGLRELESSTLADRAYAALREAIVTGELASGEKVTERGLAERLAVSPTPVREAIRRLEQDGLIERHGPRTVQVVDFHAQGSTEIRMAEGALRTIAARCAAENATPAQIAQMEKTLDAGDREIERLNAAHPGRPASARELAPLLAITRAFHDQLNLASNNPMLIRMLSMVDAFSLAARAAALESEIGADGARGALDRYRQHREILDAVRTRDAGAAERLMGEHTSTNRFVRN